MLHSDHTVVSSYGQTDDFLNKLHLNLMLRSGRAPNSSWKGSSKIQRQLFLEPLTDLGWFERIICWKMDSQEKYSALIGTVRLQQETQKTQVTRSNVHTSRLLHFTVITVSEQSSESHEGWSKKRLLLEFRMWKQLQKIRLVEIKSRWRQQQSGHTALARVAEDISNISVTLQKTDGVKRGSGWRR